MRILTSLLRNDLEGVWGPDFSGDVRICFGYSEEARWKLKGNSYLWYRDIPEVNDSGKHHTVAQSCVVFYVFSQARPGQWEGLGRGRPRRWPCAFKYIGIAKEGRVTSISLGPHIAMLTSLVWVLLGDVMVNPQISVKHKFLTFLTMDIQCSYFWWVSRILQRGDMKPRTLSPSVDILTFCHYNKYPKFFN